MAKAFLFVWQFFLNQATQKIENTDTQAQTKTNSRTEMTKENILAVALLSEKPVFLLMLSLILDEISWSFYDLVQYSCNI